MMEKTLSSGEAEKRFLGKLSGFSLNELEFLCLPHESLEKTGGKIIARLKEKKPEGFQNQIENVETAVKIRKAFRDSLPKELYESPRELGEKENAFWNSMRKYVRDLKAGNPHYTPAGFLKEWSRAATELLGWLQPRDHTAYLVDYDPYTLETHVTPHFEVIPKEKLREVDFEAIEYHPWVLNYSAEELTGTLKDALESGALEQKEKSQKSEKNRKSESTTAVMTAEEAGKTRISTGGTQDGPSAFEAVKARLKLAEILKEHPNWVATSVPIREFEGKISEVNLERTPVYVVDLEKSLGGNPDLYHVLSGVRVVDGKETIVSTALNVPALHKKLGGDLYKFVEGERKKWVEAHKALTEGKSAPPIANYVTQISPYVGGFSGALASKTFILMPTAWNRNKALLFAFYGRNPARNMLVEENRGKFDSAMKKYHEKNVSMPGRGLLFGDYFAALLAHKLYAAKGGKLA